MLHLAPLHERGEGEHREEVASGEEVNVRTAQIIIIYAVGYAQHWINDAAGSLWAIPIGLGVGLLAGYVVAKLDR